VSTACLSPVRSYPTFARLAVMRNGLQLPGGVSGLLAAGQQLHLVLLLRHLRIKVEQVRMQVLHGPYT
jgi:hypothetical protein